MAENPPRGARGGNRRDPSKLTKERVALLLQESINESGKIAKHVTQRSNSREILLKSAKKTASAESTMDATLTNLRAVESHLERALIQADTVGTSMDETTRALSRIHQLVQT